jgi:hypothetical protein
MLLEATWRVGLLDSASNSAEAAGTSADLQITVGSSVCSYEIDSQTGLSSITYKTTGTSSTREIELQPSLTGIASTRTKNTLFACPSGSSTGTYTGNSTVTGSSSSNHVGIFVD